MKALMVTVYFIGLINFYEKNGVNGREVVIPEATAGTHRSVALHAHAPTISINGLAGGKSDCINGLKGEWEKKDAGVCSRAIPLGTTIGLPSSSSFKVDSSFNAVPSLTTLCSDITGIKPVYLTNPPQHAVRASITSGTLKACTNDKRWVSYLTTGQGDLQLTFSSGTTLSSPLKADAIVSIENMPPGASPGMGSRAHFWWYYEMYDGAQVCSGMPAEPACTFPCPATFPHGIIGASTDVGCSNSNYP